MIEADGMLKQANMGGHAQVPGCGEPKRGAKIPGVSTVVSAMSLKQGKLSARRVVRALACKGLDPSKGSLDW
jgi:hypothetical protein